MQQPRRVILFTLLAAALFCAPILAQVDVIAGVSPRGVPYTIAVPATWNGGLVIWNHGFSLTPEAVPVDLGPLQELQILEGFAVAASAYSQVGWAVFETVNDLEELYDIFVGGVGTPAQVYLFGASLGGLVTAQAIEQADIGNVVGALPICGAVAGSRNWDAGLDYRLIYDVICADVPGAFIPGGPTGLPFPPPLTPDGTVAAANACFGLFGPPPTPAQQARLGKFLAVTQTPPQFIPTNIVYTTFAMADLVFDPEKLGGGIGTGNRNVDYGDAEINAKIARVGPRGNRRQLLRKNYTPTGRVGSTKIVSIHTDKDGLVIVENQSEYASVVPPGNLTVGIVQEATPSHCGFSSSETVAAWETLRGWVAGDPQPSALTLQVMCLALQPGFGGECRFNPFFQVPDMDGRARLRNPGNARRASRIKPPATPSAPEAGPVTPQAAPAAPEGETPEQRVEPAPKAPVRILDSAVTLDEPEIEVPRPREIVRREN